MKTIFANNNFAEKNVDTNKIVEAVNQGKEKLKKIPLSELIELLDMYSLELLKSKDVKYIEGVAFLSYWLRKNNLIELVRLNLKSEEFLEGFVFKGKKGIIAQPRGLICHWIAGNVPTLTIFSLMQSILVRNANILRISDRSTEYVKKLLDVFLKIKTKKGTKGSDVMASVAIVSFPRTDYASNKELSIVADARVIWGGEEAVNAISGLPKHVHCEDIIFGPKYSFGVIEKSAAESNQIDQFMLSFVYDALFLDQAACSSPQVLFIEKNSKLSTKDSSVILKESFIKGVKRYPKKGIGAGTAAKIINKRAEYALDLEKAVVCSKGVDWTILVDKDVKLEEPLQSRTIFVKEINSVKDVLPLITHKIQHIGFATLDKDKLLTFAEEATYRGASRVVPPGQMNYYDSPWDGLFYLSRLVRWNTTLLSDSLGKN